MALLGIAASLAGMLLVYLLLAEPFGLYFRFALVLLVCGLVVFLAAVGMWLLRVRPVWLRVAAVVPWLLALVLAATTTALAIDVRILLEWRIPERLTTQEWQEDLDSLAAGMVRIHPDLFSLVPRERFDSAVAATRAKIPELSHDEIVSELFRIVALPRDAHTYPFIFWPGYDLHFFPLKTYLFDDGLYVTHAGRGYRETVGSQLVAVGGVPAEELFVRFSGYVSSENEYGARDRAIGVPVAEWLDAEGVSDGTKSVVVTLENDQRGRYDVRVRSISHLAWIYWYFTRPAENTSSPAVTNDRRHQFLFEYDDAARAVYVQINQTVDQSRDESLEEFLARLDEFLSVTEFDRFILDIRNNGGGDVVPALAVTRYVADNEHVNRRGKLFVLIGRRTFSGGVSLAALLENNTKAVFVGEPTSQGPRYYAGPDLLWLPNSNLPVAVSTRLSLNSVPDDRRDRITPHISVPYTYDDFREGRDPLVAAALAYEVPAVEGVQLDVAELDRCVGRFRYGSYHILEVERTPESLRFGIDDSFERSLSRVRADMYPRSPASFSTDIRHVRLDFTAGPSVAEAVTVTWGDVERIAHRTSADYRLPIQLLQQGDIEAGTAAVLAEREIYETEVPGFEAAINRFGYRYLWAERFDDAVALFQLNVELFPGSSNTYDSLGEGYMMRGDTALAIRNYERSLELDPSNDNAVEMLERMRGAR